MSRIDELIQDFCPEGVKLVELGSVISNLRTGLNPRRNFVLNPPDAINYYITVRELSGFKITQSEKTDKLNDEALQQIQNRSKLRVGDVLFSATGTIGRTAFIQEEPTNWNIKEGVYALTPIPEYLSAKFLIYLLGKSTIKNEIIAQSDGSTVASISMAKLRKVQIPLPPLTVQNQIVSILDLFTELEDELVAELEARRKQYYFYRDSLLNFSGKEIQWQPLGEVCKILNGFAFDSNFFNTDQLGIPIIRIRDINSGFSGTYFSGKFQEKYVIHDGDIVIGMDGDFQATRWSFGEALLNQRVCKLEHFSSGVDSRYVFHQVKNAIKTIQQRTSASTVKHLSSRELEKYLIPIPQLSVQMFTADLLESFEELIANPAKGIPSEIKARQKQFEFYRDKLLTFQELTS